MGLFDIEVLDTMFEYQKIIFKGSVKSFDDV